VDLHAGVRLLSLAGCTVIGGRCASWQFLIAACMPCNQLRKSGARCARTAGSAERERERERESSKTGERRAESGDQAAGSRQQQQQQVRPQGQIGSTSALCIAKGQAPLEQYQQPKKPALSSQQGISISTYRYTI
jgi:hypothetical protein